jgi:hypothetical protein
MDVENVIRKNTGKIETFFNAHKMLCYATTIIATVFVVSLFIFFSNSKESKQTESRALTTQIQSMQDSVIALKRADLTNKNVSEEDIISAENGALMQLETTPTYKYLKHRKQDLDSNTTSPLMLILLSISILLISTIITDLIILVSTKIKLQENESTLNDPTAVIKIYKIVVTIIGASALLHFLGEIIKEISRQ